MTLDRAEASKPLAFAVSLTPFTENGTLDEDMFRAHLRRLAAANIGVYVGGSGSGEGLTLSRPETFRLYEIAREELSGRVPVLAMGIEPRTAAEMIGLAQLAKDAGLDAMQIYSILAPGATPRELESYFAEVLTAIRMPAVISIHHAVGYVVPVDVVGNIVDGFAHVVGVNCTRADIRLLDRVGKSVAVHVADLNYALSNLALGGHGFLCPEANLAPRLCAALIDSFKSGDFAQASRAYATLLRVHESFKSTGIKGIKATLRMLDLPAGHQRRPRLPLSNEELAGLHKTVKALDIPGIERMPS